MQTERIELLNKSIIKCKKCDRLVQFRKHISKTKRKEYINENYWGKPITGFGDINAEILIVGLAPAAHGGTRTGRVFTGDKSSQFLYECLYKAEISNQPYSININDGLKLTKTYITTALKCVPPEDKPTSKELETCSIYFKRELEILNKTKTILCLGKIAFEAIVKYYIKNYGKFRIKPSFSHGALIKLPDNKILAGCYHPSPRNVNTGRLNKNMMVSFIKKIIKLT